jgi:hypothetical protein
MRLRTIAASLLLWIFSVRFCLADCSTTNVGIIPLPDLGTGIYRGFAGGLYPNGLNARPAEHEAVGLYLAENEIQPRDAAGNVETNSGKIVLLSIGMSNTTQEWASKGTQNFRALANADPSRNPRLVIVDGAQGGQPADAWTNINAATWQIVQTNRLPAAGVTTQQVQVLWIKQAHARPSSAFPSHAQLLQRDVEKILQNAKIRFPNLKIAYLSSRTRAYTTVQGSLNPEPQAFESAFAVRWIIEKQLSGASDVNYDPAKGAVVAPWISWGPYLWADGTTPRSDGFTWLCNDLESDFTHPSAAGGVPKVGRQLLAFFKTDATATPWFLRKNVVGQPPQCSPSASATSGAAPLTIIFRANATDSDGAIRDYQWTFEDGTFSTNRNPVKTFPAPGLYHAHVTVTDNSGNTTMATLAIDVSPPRSTLLSPRFTNGVFAFQVIGPTNVDHIVEASSDSKAWSQIYTNRPPFWFSEPGVSSNRSYRAVAP